MRPEPLVWQGFARAQDLDGAFTAKGGDLCPGARGPPPQRLRSPRGGRVLGQCPGDPGMWGPERGRRLSGPRPLGPSTTLGTSVEHTVGQKAFAGPLSRYAGHCLAEGRSAGPPSLKPCDCTQDRAGRDSILVMSAASSPSPAWAGIWAGGLGRPMKGHSAQNPSRGSPSCLASWPEGWGMQGHPHVWAPGSLPLWGGEEVL